jgi:hypothetical protein
MRTDEDDVRALLEVEDDVNVEQFMEVASELVEEICVPLGYSDTRLELIERWLSAHFVSVKHARLTSESAGGISESYWSSAGMCLDLTPYGQQVKLLDTLGGLAALDKDAKNGGKGKASVTWMGTSKDTAI